MNKTAQIIYKNIVVKKNLKTVKSQVELIKALAKGDTLHETAIKAGLSYFNLQKRTQLLYKKFNVKYRKDLITKALECQIIKHSDVTTKFRQRYACKILNQSYKSCTHISEPLTKQETKYIELAAKGLTKNNIITSMNLLNMNYCNYIQSQICRKLNAKNITQAVAFAMRLDIVK